MAKRVSRQQMPLSSHPFRPPSTRGPILTSRLQAASTASHLDTDRAIMFEHMAFKVFLSYSTDPDEQVVVWRLQTLAAVHGIQVYVPYRLGRTSFRSAAKLQLSQEVTNAINTADCVMAIITSRMAPVVQQELSYALGKGKLVIPIVQAGVGDGSLLSMFPQVFLYSPAANTGEVESQVIKFLKQRKLSKEKQQAIAALVTVGLGMLLLSGLPKK